MLKVYEKVKKFIKDNYKFLIVYSLVFLFCLWPLPYYIYTGGGTINLQNRIKISSENLEKGSFNLAYVKSVKATIPTYLLSYLFDWDVERIDDLKLETEEDANDVWQRERLYLQESIDNAIISAYQLKGENITINKEVYKVLSVDKQAKTDMLVGDIILKINDIEVKNYDDVKEIISSCTIGENVKILVLRNDKEILCDAKIIEHNKEKKLGIYLIKSYDYEYDRQIELGFTTKEGGSSGGFMLSLAIYNRLNEKDLTDGLKIVGTGTISSDGKVGSIDGVKYKLRGAVSDKADLFFVPSGRNFEEAIKEKEKHGYKITIVEVATLQDAINYLESRL